MSEPGKATGKERDELTALRARIAELERQLAAFDARYQDLYEHAPDMFVSVDARAGKIIQCNKTLAEVTGYRKDEIVGHPLLAIYHPDCHDRARKAFQRFRRAGELRNADLEIKRKDGGKIHVILNVSAVRGPDGEILRSRSILREVSDRDETAAALKMSEALVRAMFDSALDAIIGMDHQGHVIDFNPAAERMFGLRREETVGKPLVDLIIPPSLRESHVHGLSRYLQEGKARVLGKRVELTGMRSGGTEFPVELTITRLDLAGPARFVGFLRDITERKRLEKDVLEISHEEQRRLAQDLHDGLAQELYGTALLASKTRSKLTEKNVPEAEALSEISDLLQTAIGTMRGVVDGLYPLHPKTGGLKSALERMVADIARVHNVHCHLEWDGNSAKLDDDATMHLYYIAREAVTNSAKHSGSQDILVAVQVDRNRVALTIEDSGVGMPPESELEVGGKGLRIMNYRARLIGGELQIRRKPESGTRVTCTVSTADRSS